MDHDHDDNIRRFGTCFPCVAADAKAAVENREAPLPHALPDAGPEQPTLDGAPSAGRQLNLVWQVVRDGHWHTLAAIAQQINMPEASVSARLRDLRKPEHGGFTVTKRLTDDRQFGYRVLAPARSMAHAAS